MSAETLAGRPRCADCTHYQGSNPMTGYCRRYPPTMFPVATANPLRPGDAEMSPCSFYPPVRHDGSCGEHPEFAAWLTAARAAQAH